MSTAHTIGELKAMIEDLPDDTRLFTFGGDHAAYPAGASIGYVTYWNEYRCYNEFFSDDDMQEGEEKIPGLLIWE